MISKKKISSHVQDKWFNEWYVACINYYHNYSYDIWKSWSTIIYFSNKSRVGGVSFPTNSISSNDSLIKVWEYGMIVYFIKILDPKFSFFSTLTKFQQCMFKKICWILTSPNGPTKIPYSRPLYLEVHYILIEYENGRAKASHYLVQIIDYDDLYDQWQEWF